MALTLVLGMHRSGTSLVARALAEAGLYPGRGEDMLAAQADNPLGFYERRDLVDANEALLASTGASWFEPPGAVLGESGLPAGADAAVAGVTGALEHAAEAGRGTFLKDPRLCLTWPAWASPATVVLYVYRNPLAVADSLRRRNAFPLGYGLALWEHYNRCAIAALRGRQYACVSYDAIAADPRELERLLERLGALGLPVQAQLPAELFEAGLRHAATAADFAAGDRALQSYEQTLLAEYCEALCAGGPLTPLPAASPSLQAHIVDYARALAPLAEVVETGNARREAEALMEERTAERDRALDRLRATETDYAALAAAHDAERTAHGRLQAVHEAMEAEHEALAAAHQAQVEAYDALADEHRALEQQRAELKAAQDALAQKADYLFHTLSEAYGNLQAYEASPLGRVQRQFSRAYKLLTGRHGTATRYDNVIIAARGHAQDFGLPGPEARPSRLAMASDVLRYVARNPAGSARSFSWPRLKRAASVFFRSSPEDLGVWIRARFPEQAGERLVFDPKAMDPDLDTLELAFPEHDRPRVSIIVPVYNDYRVTAHCLQALHEHLDATPVEVIVADDGSADLTTSLEKRMAGVRVVRGENVGFLRNCNRAAREARGDFVLLLNNDTAVTAGWLAPLLAVFEDESVGAAGPMLLFGDGTLQEAGGILWRDASGWNFGRGDAPDKPAYTYRKAVDYVSGACLMVRRGLWEDIGGFDERFVPAYYEDADLCFAVRAAGYRVVYQPASRIFHFEGVSNGTDLAAGVKQHQVRNQGVFADKWQAVLEAEHFDNARHVTWARDRSARRRCVLVIDHYVPHHDKDAGSRSTFLYVQLLLAMGYRVQFMGANFFPHQPYTQALQQLGVEVLAGESIARDLDRWFAEHAPYIDEIFLHRPHVAEQFLPQLSTLAPRPAVSFFGHDLHYLRIQREAAVLADPELEKSAASWRKREYAVFEQVDRIYYFSEVEIDEIARERPGLALRTVPLYALKDRPLPAYAPTAPRHLLFVGGFNHPPNVDAARWLVNDILPLINAACKGVQVHLVGSNPGEQVQALASAQVTVHGYVSDEELAALYRQVGLAVVPLRYGAGVKGKVIEAVQHNVPLVTTPTGAEGIPDAAEVLWTADSAPALAEAIVGIVEGRAELAPRMARYGEWLATHFSRGRAEAMLRRDLLPPQRDPGGLAG
ncbi:glycosyltransferase [Pseudohaliea rubra]|uniref:Glycosyltransferase n=1 Tax=Pseudohaliea rubra DSM 19751 TaxID=1265313 RepID=A0A095X1J4_9GAMM|nr:glycosyltransferase [Pseudohaliea rubra]KGE04734.1 Glycosyltransferase [Pseudohaliea rubra DSM 19751]